MKETVSRVTELLFVAKQVPVAGTLCMHTVNDGSSSVTLSSRMQNRALSCAIKVFEAKNTVIFLKAIPAF